MGEKIVINYIGPRALFYIFVTLSWRFTLGLFSNSPGAEGLSGNWVLGWEQKTGRQYVTRFLIEQR